MLRLFRTFHKDDDAGHLETIRATTGMTGIAFLTFTVLHLFNGGDMSTEWMAMGLAGIVGLVFSAIYMKLVHERTTTKK